MLILKQLRRKKNISQSDLADSIGVSLRTIQLYEKKNANIPIKNLTKIADYFDMRIDQLYAYEVNESDVIYDKESNDSQKAHTIRKLGPGKYLLTVPLIIGDKQRDYLNNRDSAKFSNTLPHIGFLVDQVSVGNYMAFEIINGSMDNGQANGIPQRSVVLGKRVSEKNVFKKLKEDSSQWILVCNNNIMCKKIAAYDKKNGLVSCHSLNNSPEYPDFEVPVKDVLEFYKLIKKQVD